MFERGGLLLVPFPFSELSAAKRRPVPALTGPDGYGDSYRASGHLTPQTEHGLPLAEADLVQGKLSAASWIRTDRIVTLNASLVVKTIARVSDRIAAAAVERFCAHIGYPERTQ